MPQVTFYFDLGSPYAYLAAERLTDVLSEPAQWQPLSLGGLFKANGRSSWALDDYQRRQAGSAEVERRARDYGLPPIHWPDPWPGNYLMAMRAATFDEVLFGDLFSRHDTALESIRKSVVGALARTHDALDERQRARLADLVERGPAIFRRRSWGFGPFEPECM